MRSTPTVRFLGLDASEARYETARAAVLPVPYERTTNYGRGTVYGPAAIVDASHQVELYDEELRAEPHVQGIATLPPIFASGEAPEDALAEIEAGAHEHLAAGKFLVTLGGEHSLSLAGVRAANRVLGGDAGQLGVVQFDAHSDLRNEYAGSPLSHACVMKRILDEGHPTLAVGIRALCAPEGDLIAERELPVIWGWELEDPDVEERFQTALDALPERIYLTFDIDFFDPALIPATGTPEPGGGRWWPTLKLLRRLFRSKRVVAMDVVELAPIKRLHACDFTVARLVYKCLGYHWAHREESA